MSRFDYVAELDGPQGRIDATGRRMPGKGGGMMGGLLGAALGYATGGFSLMGTALSAGQAAMAGFSLGSTLLGGEQEAKTPTVNIQQPEAAPVSQAAKAPTAGTARDGMTGTGQAGGAPGIAQTMLTGAGGVDPATLGLGKNTLLGR